MNCCLHCIKGSDFKESNCLNNHFYKDNDSYCFFIMLRDSCVRKKKYCKVLYISHKTYWDNMHGICGNMTYCRGICFVDTSIVFLRRIPHSVYTSLKTCGLLKRIQDTSR